MDNNNKKKNIHVIVEGVRYEGYIVRGIYLSEEAAEAAASSHVASQNADGCYYERMGDDVLIWRDGDSYVEVMEYPLGKLF